MSNLFELFGVRTDAKADWKMIVAGQKCPYTGGSCFKTRKSDPGTSIGTCTGRFGAEERPLVICPNRFLADRQVFSDCLPLLRHVAGNELHIIPEVQLPGGNVDYFLVSSRDGKPDDFVGVEFQGLDTTGSMWPSRQEFLRRQGLRIGVRDRGGTSPGVNWKMTAKTILIQLHHKIESFESLGKRLVLVLQDDLMAYMTHQFSFGHLSEPPLTSDSMLFHSYALGEQDSRLRLVSVRGTNRAGIAAALDLGSDARLTAEKIIMILQAKISNETRWKPV